jgi:Flp pilus assembly protein TadG
MGKRSSMLTNKTGACHTPFAPVPMAASIERNTRRRRREQGAEVLEFGLVLATLLLVLFGIITMARAYNIYQSITRAAREGARMAVLPSAVWQGNQYMDGSGVSQSSSTVFNNYIAPALQAANLNPANVIGYTEQVGWLNPGGTNQQCGVVVSFKYPYTLFLPFTNSNLTTINIPAHVQMRRENQPSGGTCP